MIQTFRQFSSRCVIAMMLCTVLVSPCHANPIFCWETQDAIGVRWHTVILQSRGDSSVQAVVWSNSGKTVVFGSRGLWRRSLPAMSLAKCNEAATAFMSAATIGRDSLVVPRIGVFKLITSDAELDAVRRIWTGTRQQSGLTFFPLQPWSPKNEPSVSELCHDWIPWNPWNAVMLRRVMSRLECPADLDLRFKEGTEAKERARVAICNESIVQVAELPYEANRYRLVVKPILSVFRGDSIRVLSADGTELQSLRLADKNVVDMRGAKEGMYYISGLGRPIGFRFVSR